MSEIARSLDRLTEFAQDWFIAENQRRRQEAKEERAAQVSMYSALLDENKSRLSDIEKKYEDAKINYETMGGDLERLNLKDRTYAGEEMRDIIHQGPIAFLDEMSTQTKDNIANLQENIDKLNRATDVANLLEEYIAFADPAVSGDPTKLEPAEFEAAVNRFKAQADYVLNQPLTEEDLDALTGPLSRLQSPAKLKAIEISAAERRAKDIEAINTLYGSESAGYMQKKQILKARTEEIDFTVNKLLDKVEGRSTTTFMPYAALKDELVNANNNTERGDAEDAIEEFKKKKKLLMMPPLGLNLTEEQAAAIDQQAMDNIEGFWSAMQEARDTKNPNKDNIINYIEKAAIDYQRVVRMNPGQASTFAALWMREIGVDITDDNLVGTLVSAREMREQLMIERANLSLQYGVEEGIEIGTPLDLGFGVQGDFDNQVEANLLSPSQLLHQYAWEDKEDTTKILPPTIQPYYPDEDSMMRDIYGQTNDEIRDSILLEQTGLTLEGIDESINLSSDVISKEYLELFNQDPMQANVGFNRTSIAKDFKTKHGLTSSVMRSLQKLAIAEKSPSSSEDYIDDLREQIAGKLEGASTRNKERKIASLKKVGVPIMNAYANNADLDEGEASLLFEAIPDVDSVVKRWKESTTRDKFSVWLRKMITRGLVDEINYEAFESLL